MRSFYTEANAMANIDDNLKHYFQDTCAYDLGGSGRWYIKDSKATGRIKYVTAEIIYSDYVKKLAALKLECPTPLTDFKDWVEAVTPKQTAQKVYFRNLPQVTNWIYEQLRSPVCPFKLSPKYDMIQYVSNSVEVAAGEGDLVGWLNCRAADLNKSKVYKTGLVSSGWDILKKEMCANCVGMLRESIAYDPNDIPTMDVFIKSLYEYLQIKEPYEIFEMLFKHWCWTLKRHIWDKDVKWHIWVNFSGAQGIGKSELVRRMCNFIREFFAEATLNAFNDVEKQYKLFTDTYVLFFDELNKGDNKDSVVEMTLNSSAIDSIKDMVTKDIITVRMYNTQNQGKFKNKFTPISVANNRLYDVIYDGEAMRRWFDFYCQRETIPASYDEINAILATFPDALKGIDENSDDGYWDHTSEIGRKITEIQKTYVPTNTSTNSWVSYCEVQPDLTFDPKNKFNARLYNFYKEYCKSVGRGCASMDRASAILKRLWPNAVNDEGDVFVTVGRVVKSDGSEIEKQEGLKEI